MSNSSSSVRVWDILVRIFHWSLVFAFAVAYISSEEENSIHIVSGYVVLGLIVFRVIWGVVGSKYARFSDFVYSPSTVIQYAKNSLAGNAKNYLGHNPIGGWMVIAMLLMLLVITLSGLKVYAIEEGKGLLASHVNITLVSPAVAEEDDDERKNVAKGDKSAEKFWEEIHEVSTNLMLLMILLHIVGVIKSSRQNSENLVKSMLTGNKELK